MDSEGQLKDHQTLIADRMATANGTMNNAGSLGKSQYNIRIGREIKILREK